VTDSDVDTQRQQLQLLDANLRADYAFGTIPVAEIQTGVGLWLYLPTSDVSQFETLMLGAALRLTLNRKLGEHFALDFIGTFRKNFHEYESPVLDASASSPPPVFIRRGGPEDLPGTLVAIGANNVSHYFYNIGWVTWMPIEHMAVILAYGMTNSFTYPTRRDSLSSMYAVGGAGQRDSAVGVIEVAYELNKRFGLGAGITTLSAPKSEDNQSFRFPFYDFEGTARNFTLFFIDMTISEPLGG
jgi:hypothetical protein